MSNVLTLANLSFHEPRSAWPNEAHDFTPWLGDNLHQLSDAIGLKLELTAKEHLVGRFCADLVARNVVTDEVVLIENQLARSDHTHLGQIMTYLAGTDAKLIIWVAPEFCEEHLSAIRWLNEHSAEEFSFFAVRLRLVRIGESKPAALFEALEKPNRWDRRIRLETQASRGLSPTVQRRREFWVQYDRLHPSGGQDSTDGGFTTRWRNVPDTGWNIVRWIDGDDVSIFLRTNRTAKQEDVHASITSWGEQFGAKIGVEQGVDSGNYPFDDSNTFELSSEHGREEAIAWLERRTNDYLTAFKKLGIR